MVTGGPDAPELPGAPEPSEFPPAAATYGTEDEQPEPDPAVEVEPDPAVQPEPPPAVPEEPAAATPPMGGPEPPSDAPQEEPSADTQQTDVPPSQQPPAAAGPPGEAERKGSGAKWCLLGCGILFVLAIIATVVLWALAGWAGERIEELPDTATNQLERWEQDAPEGTGDADLSETVDGDGVGDQGEIPDDLSALVGRLGEAADAVSAAVRSANVEGFDPGSVPPDMLPTFYGFLVSLAQLSPDGARRWMTDEAAAGARLDEWEEAREHHTHMRFVHRHHETLSDGTEQFIIVEVVEVRESGEPMDMPWQIEFSKVGNRWLVTRFE